MTATTAKLGAGVGAEVIGADRARLLTDDAFPAWCLDALEANGVLVFRALHIDDATQVAFSKKLGRVEVFGKGERPEIFRVSLDPAKNPRAEYLRGTFDWHIDGATEDIPIMATVLSAHAVADSGGETEFASTYAAYDALTDDEKERFEDVRVVHSFEAAQRLVNPDPTPEELARWQTPTGEGAPAGLAAPLRAPFARARRDRVARRRHGRRTRGVRCSPTSWRGRRLTERVYRHEWTVGDLVIWDNRGVMHRACPYDPASARDMHRTTLSGDEADPVKAL